MNLEKYCYKALLKKKVLQRGPKLRVYVTFQEQSSLTFPTPEDHLTKFVPFRSEQP